LLYSIVVMETCLFAKLLLSNRCCMFVYLVVIAQQWVCMPQYVSHVSDHIYIYIYSYVLVTRHRIQIVNWIYWLLIHLIYKQLHGLHVFTVIHSPSYHSWLVPYWFCLHRHIARCQAVITGILHNMSCSQQLLHFVFICCTPNIKCRLWVLCTHLLPQKCVLTSWCVTVDSSATFLTPRFWF
jgi:hypothetical protein